MNVSTPKEKADELFDKFKPSSSDKFDISHIKKCCLVCLFEMTEIANTYKEIKFIQEVTVEIKKL